MLWHHFILSVFCIIPYIQYSVEAKSNTSNGQYKNGLSKITAFQVNQNVSKDPKVLNVHIVPHSHDDVGWLKTVDQYYYGLNNTIQDACVQRILHSVIRALQENPERKFTFVEMAFFTMWWKEQNRETQYIVRMLVNGNRLSFANGGWCMHDEATTHFIGMIDQTTLGHTFLKETFDYTPTVGWQLDPFGHSATQASLLSADAGFNAVYMGRIDFVDREKRIATQNCEGIWQSSKSLPQNKVFWGLTGSYDGNYGPPKGFCFDPKCLEDEPIVENFNVHRRVDEFIEKVSWQGQRTRGNNIMMTFGSDFQYENADANYFMIDKLIRYVNEHNSKGLLNTTMLGRFHSVNVFYSTPEMYTMAKHAEKHQWDVKLDDFFPYSHKNHSFWTGYFTSRPALKRLERVGSSFLQFARQIEVMANDNNKDTNSSSWTMEESNLNSLDSAVSVLQHHDGISGTSKQHVAYDYAKRVDKGMKDAIQYVERTLQSLLGTSIDLSYCQHLNLTVCGVTQRLTEEENDSDLYVVVFNSLGKTRDEIFSIPVSIDATYKVYQVTENDDQIIESALLPSKNPTKAKKGAKYTLYVETKNIPAVGAMILRIEMIMTPSAVHPTIARSCDSSEDSHTNGTTTRKEADDTFVLSTGTMNVTFNRMTGALKHIQSGETNMDISQEWGYYRSFEWTKDMKLPKRAKPHSGLKQNSGAYFLRPYPNETLNLLEYQCNRIRVFVSPIVSEVYVEYSSWVKQIIRLKRDTSYVEIDFTVGPIPVEDGVGKEAVVRYKSSSIQNSGIFYTDSNGREFQKRVRGSRQTWDYIEHEPIAGNYYPVTSAMFIQGNNLSMGILNDRAQGGSSLSDGSLELMVHRRTLADDDAGVGEPLDETDEGITPYPPYGQVQRMGQGIKIRGTHRLVIGDDNGARWVRPGMEELFSPVYLFFGSKSSDSSSTSENVLFRKTSLSALNEVLPPNIMLVTLQKKVLKSKRSSRSFFLVRLGHSYSIEEGPLSMPARMDLSNLFSSFQVQYIEELTLTGNQKRDDWLSQQLLWNDPIDSDHINMGTNITANMSIEIFPMEIRTFAFFTDDPPSKEINPSTLAETSSFIGGVIFGIFIASLLIILGIGIISLLKNKNKIPSSWSKKSIFQKNTKSRTKNEYQTVQGTFI